MRLEAEKPNQQNSQRGGCGEHKGGSKSVLPVHLAHGRLQGMAYSPSRFTLDMFP